MQRGQAEGVAIQLEVVIDRCEASIRRGYRYQLGKREGMEGKGKIHGQSQLSILPVKKIADLHI